MKKKIALLLALFLFSVEAEAANTSLYNIDASSGALAIGAETASSGTVLDLSGSPNASLALALPSGTSAQRPTSPINGELRYNNTTGTVDSYQAGEWSGISGENAQAVEYRSGNWYASSFGNVGSALLATKARLWASPIIIHRKAVFSSIGFFVGTGGSGSEAKFCLYKSNGTGQAPGDLVTGGSVSTGVATVTSSAEVVGVFDSAVTLYPGLYWMASMHDWSTTPPTVSIRGNVASAIYYSGSSGIYNAIGANGAFGSSLPYKDITYASGCPATFGTPTGYANEAQQPILALKVQ